MSIALGESLLFIPSKNVIEHLGLVLFRERDRRRSDEALLRLLLIAFETFQHLLQSKVDLRALVIMDVVVETDLLGNLF